MAIKIGINGFGRIGRIVLRIMCENPETFDIRGINLRKADIDYMVYLLKYDSVFRNFPGMVEHAGGDLIVNGHKIKVYSESDAAMINWADSEAEYIIESTGANNTTDKASRHFKGGAKKVILTAPAKDDATPTFVYGVNSDEYRPDMKVISNASCTTNCLAPLAYVIHKTFGIEQSLMSTIHAATAKQGGRLPRRQRLAYRTFHPQQHHPHLHRRRQGRGSGDPLPEGQNDRNGFPRSHCRRVRGGSDRPPQHQRLLCRYLL